ncbi:hypothetical protein SAMN04487828_1395 [Prevotella sp. lc2012]|nr:hypothetical protein SAMN04487828_1395 [Prevotella sp. lc2012]
MAFSNVSPIAMSPATPLCPSAVPELVEASPPRSLSLSRSSFARLACPRRVNRWCGGPSFSFCHQKENGSKRKSAKTSCLGGLLSDFSSHSMNSLRSNSISYFVPWLAPRAKTQYGSENRTPSKDLLVRSVFEEAARSLRPSAVPELVEASPPRSLSLSRSSFARLACPRRVNRRVCRNIEARSRERSRQTFLKTRFAHISDQRSSGWSERTLM